MAISFTKLASEIWRAFATDGVPASGAHRVVKGDARVWGGEVQDALDDHDDRLEVLEAIVLNGSATYDPASLVDGAGATTTVTVTGAALGDFAVASFSNDLQGISLTAWVSAANTVSVRFQNESGGTLDLASGTLRARVFEA